MCLQEKQGHFLCSCRTFSSRQAVNLDYLHYLRQALLSPLQKHGTEGAGQAVQLLDDYQLVKEDVDSIMEISVWGGQPDPYSKLDSKVSIKETYLRMWLRPTEELVLFFFFPFAYFFLVDPGQGSFHPSLQQRSSLDAVLPADSEEEPTWWRRVGARRRRQRTRGVRRWRQP